jgi:lysozyme
LVKKMTGIEPFIILGVMAAIAKNNSGGIENFIAQFEGYKEAQSNGDAVAYADPGYGWTLPTIGFGTTHYPGGAAVKRGDRITKAQALQFLNHEADLKRNDILSKLAVPLSQNQLDALTSFAYNVGRTQLYSSTLWQKLQAGKSKAEVAAEFGKFIYSNHKKMPGLVTRRAAEAKLFLS